ncbi:D-alanine--D-alanine ligase family protein [Rhizohabitans arisaemae]|uniref:D-alanine--D-alanine ligase family protein n=1 Tax=Rhizohabitans arisaemae TaxID=2720610 RepID=UPI0024B1DD44|nr:ATP-grasp domain-containing protein [Rhizohabitans arisaemae]
MTEITADAQWPDLDGADLVIPLVYGVEGEQGSITAVLEGLGVPYLGSDSATCALIAHKPGAKRMLDRAGVATPEFVSVDAEAIRHYEGMNALRSGAERIGYPVVVKPARQCQGVGVHLVETPEELPAAVMAAFAHGGEVLVEEYVEGVELSVCLVGRGLRPLIPVEIRSAGRLCDIHVRMSENGVKYIAPPDLTSPELAVVTKAAMDAGRVLGVRDLARVDLILGPDGPQVLDVTPCPGLSDRSVAATAATAQGQSYEDLIERIVGDAGRRVPRERSR